MLSVFANTYRHTDYESKSIAGAVWRVDAFRGYYVCNCPGVASSYDGSCEHMRAEVLRDQRAEKEAKDMTNDTGNAVAIRDNTPQELAPLPMATPSFLPSKDQYSMMLNIASLATKGAEGSDDSMRALPKGIKTPEQAMTVMLAGAEMGFTPFASFRVLFPLNGRLELYSQGLISLVRARDKTARFVFHRYEHDGADVELFRGGESVIRVAYDSTDRARSHQGFTKLGTWKTAQSGKRYLEPRREADGRVMYEADEESPWERYGRDMYAYNAIKRCVRLGAPDLVNVAPFYYAELDEPRDVIDAEAVKVPSSPLQKALQEGTVEPAAVFSDEPADDGPAAATAQEQASTQDSTPQPAADDNAPAPKADADAIKALATRTRTEYKAEYPAWYRDFVRDQLGGVDWRADSQLTVRAVREGLRSLRELRGEVDPTEVGAMTQEREETDHQDEDQHEGPGAAQQIRERVEDREAAERADKVEERGIPPEQIEQAAQREREKAAGEGAEQTGSPA